MENKKTEFYSVEHIGLHNVGKIIWNPSTPELYEEIVRRREGAITHLGPIVVRTGIHTGRSPNDKFLVKEKTSEDEIWWGKVNRPFSPEKFNFIYSRLLAYLQGKDIFIQDCFAGAHPKYRRPIRVITEDAWHNLFARNMFVQIRDDEMDKLHVPEFTIINVPNFHAVPELDGTNSSAFVIEHFEKKLILIGGTIYAGEIKKAVFTVMNYLLPHDHVFPMHCSANYGKDDDVAIFFGLSGTGKTTLSADPERILIGDDEHGWSDDGIFNFEGGCYAKVISLSSEAEPEIFETTRKFGTILENVGYDSHTRRIDLDDASLTENTRAGYPLTHIPNADRTGFAGQPKNVIFLTCDAFGVMPPVAKLTREQAMYHFLSGYTAKVAGTEKGLGNEPQATFSACYGAPFMALPPIVYSNLLGERIKKHGVSCWLINTGWNGGPYGVGKRISIAHTRAIVRATLSGELDNIGTEVDPVFGLNVPVSCPGVPDEILKPSEAWSDKTAYKEKAAELAQRFRDNFSQLEGDIPEEVRKAGL